MLKKEKATLSLPDKSGYMKVKELSKKTRHIRIKDLVQIDEKQYEYLVVINNAPSAQLVGEMLREQIQKGIVHITSCKYGMNHISINICETLESE